MISDDMHHSTRYRLRLPQCTLFDRFPGYRGRSLAL